MPKILVFSGSTRPASYNRRLAGIAARELRAFGADVTEISLADYPLPFVDEDWRANPVEAAVKLRTLFDAHQGMFIACPEYNSGYTPLLKNALDWASIVKPGLGLVGKVIALGGAGPGIRGGYRAMTQLRSALELGYGALVIPEMVSITGAAKALPEEGILADDAAKNQLANTLRRLIVEASFTRA
jgi:NAD(P)H-dependent FMN reductase